VSDTARCISNRRDSIKGIIIEKNGYGGVQDRGRRYMRRERHRRKIETTGQESCIYVLRSSESNLESGTLGTVLAASCK
jgi:hypothetical protein